MAQVNITLNQEEILQLLSSDDSADVLKSLLQKSLNQFLVAESTEMLRAEPYERTKDRTDSRNGFRERPLTTRIGTITLAVPRHRDKPFHTMIFENYQRSETALITTMAEMVISGVSTRKISNIMETLCGKEFSRSTVSEACKHLDEEVETFRNRPIEARKYPFLMLDATYFKVRENHKIRAKAFMVAVGITKEGNREVLGFDLYEDESNSSWCSFIQQLKNRGLQYVVMFTSDAHPSIRYAMNREYPEAVWQRCQFHFTRNILDATPKSYKAGLESELREMFNAKSFPEAERLRDSILQDYSDVAEKAMDILENGFEDSMVVTLLPNEMRQSLRTSNTVERLNGELKRRSYVIKVFPNPESVIRLMGSVTIDYNDLLIARRKMFYNTSISKITDQIRDQLMHIARMQANRDQVA